MLDVQGAEMLREEIRVLLNDSRSNMVGLLVPVHMLADLLGPRSGGFVPDLYVSDYMRKYGDVGDSRLRSMCAKGCFPDTTLPDGKVVPGAYKDRNGNWRITMEGIRARQEADREAAVTRRSAPGSKDSGAAAEATLEAPERKDATRTRRRRNPGGREKALRPPRRPGEGKWREKLSARREQG